MYRCTLTSGRQQVLSAGHTVVGTVCGGGGGGRRFVIHFELDGGRRQGGRRQLVSVRSGTSSAVRKGRVRTEVRHVVGGTVFVGRHVGVAAAKAAAAAKVAATAKATAIVVVVVHLYVHDLLLRTGIDRH